MKICIFAETKKFDLSLYKVLCSRILKECFSVNSIDIIDHSFDPGGKGLLIKQVPSLIDPIKERNPDLKLIFIFIDSDNLTYKKQRKKMVKALQGKVRNHSSNLIAIACPQRNIEAWLLSDVEVLNSFLDIELRMFPKAESIVDPKEEFSKIWGHTGRKEKINSFALKITQSIDIHLLSRRSLSFHSFHEDLRSIIPSISSRNIHHR